MEHFLKPWGRTLNGEVRWSGDEPGDQGTIYVRDNEVEAVDDTITNNGPTWQPTPTQAEALNILDNIASCAGYRESQGDLWLGPRLAQLRDYIQKKEAHQ